MGSARRLTVVASYGRLGSSTRVRGFDWLDHLGLAADTHTYLGTSTAGASILLGAPLGVVKAEIGLRRLTRSSSLGSLLLLRNASPLSNGAVERRLLAAASRGVYDFDDALMHQQPGAAASLLSRARAWTASVRAADQVIAGNSYLADAASNLNSAVSVIPSCVDPGQYARKLVYRLNDPPVAVWLGSPSTERYLQAIAPSLLRGHRHSGLRLRLVSAGAAPLGPLSAMVDRVRWRPGLAEATLASADFGIMPLPDEPWARGKCAYKLLQYGASGLPVIGSPVGVNRTVLERTAGLSATSDDEWTDVLRLMLAESDEKRHLRGSTARAAVKQHYSFVRWAAEWKRLVLGQEAA